MVKISRLSLLAFIGFVLMASGGHAFSHKGPVDEEGCHYDWQGRKHCH